MSLLFDISSLKFSILIITRTLRFLRGQQAMEESETVPYLDTHKYQGTWVDCNNSYSAVKISVTMRNIEICLVGCNNYSVIEISITRNARS